MQKELKKWNKLHVRHGYILWQAKHNRKLRMNLGYQDSRPTPYFISKRTRYGSGANHAPDYGMFKTR